ncbi:MAG: hypothetical protein H0V34_03350 [Gammaproteobacteria bacterium]|nr:hypothetical protein [Gammaproteobacteria bacterium]
MTDQIEHKFQATAIALDIAMGCLMATLSAHPQIRDDLSARLDETMVALPDKLRGIADILYAYKRKLDTGRPESKERH